MSENTGAGSEVKVSPEVRDLFNLRIKAAGGVIREPKKYDLPEEYDTSSVAEEDRPRVDYFIKKAEQYLSFPSFYVGFSDPSRDKFKANLERQMKKVYGERGVEEFKILWDQNKLRNNRLRPLVIVSDIAESAKIPPVLVENLMNSVQETLTFEMGKELKGMSEEERASRLDKTVEPEEKIRQADKISDSLAEVLIFLGKKS